MEPKEDYVSIETAQLLNEKGFDIPCRAAYIWNQGYELCTLFSKPLHFNREGGLEDYDDTSVPRISAPTLQVVMKWLREIHNLHITIDPYITTKGVMYTYRIYNLARNKVSLLKAKGEFKNNESACEDAIRYCLETLI